MTALADSVPAVTGRPLEGRTAIVTGASAGLGHRFAEVLAAAGATVFAAARRADRLEGLRERWDTVQPVTCDVGRGADRESLIELAAGTTGRIDVLVNNAGIGGPMRIEDEDAATLARVLDVNLVAAYELCRLAGPRMGDGASIVNVASILGLVSGAPMGGASYAASKGALIALTRELAGQWGPRGIRVNALAPGWFHTEMTEDLFGDEKSRAWVERNTMLRRGGAVDELDGSMLFLATAASSYVTGQTLVVDGGWTAR